MTSAFCGSEERSRVERLTPRSASAGCACEESQAGTSAEEHASQQRNKKAKPSTAKEGLASMGMFFASGKARARMVCEPA